MLNRIRAVPFLFFLTASVFVFNANAEETPDLLAQFEKRVHTVTLDNGMTVLLLRRAVAPVVSFEMNFKAGGIDEVSGKTGLAHLFEHMMFKGTRTIGTTNYAAEKKIMDAIDVKMVELYALEDSAADPKKIEAAQEAIAALQKAQDRYIVPNELDAIYQRAGAVGLNAFTAQDRTAFLISLPANKWELWALLESDRMKHPVLRQFYKERDVVMEERRMRTENNPQGKLWEALVASAFWASPYHVPTIGWMSDLARLTRQDAESFFKRYYSASNAACAIVGDIDPQRVATTLRKYFSGMPKEPLPERSITKEPPQDGERRIQIIYDAEPSLLMGFRKPNSPHPDDTAFQFLAEILSTGRTSRFYQNLVEKKIAASAWAGNGVPGERIENLFVIGAAPLAPNTLLKIEAAVWQEIKRVQLTPVSQAEMEKIRKQLKSDWVRQMSSNSGLAGALAYYQSVHGDWRKMLRDYQNFEKVTPQDIQRVAQQYLLRKNLTIVTLQRDHS